MYYIENVQIFVGKIKIRFRYDIIIFAYLITLYGI